MEGDNGKSAPGSQKIRHLVDGIFQNLQFLVQFDPNRLKCPLGRVASRGSHLGGNRGFYNLNQFSCCLNLFFLTCPDNVLGNILSEPVFPIIFDNMEQL